MILILLGCVSVANNKNYERHHVSGPFAQNLFTAMIVQTSMRYSTFAASGNAGSLHRLWLSRQRELHCDHRERCDHTGLPSPSESRPRSVATWEGYTVITSDSPEMSDYVYEEDSRTSDNSDVFSCGAFQEPRGGAGGTSVKPQYVYGCYGPLTSRPLYEPPPM